jgi:carbamate kinase
MRVVVALGGNALLRRGQPMTAANQRDNVGIAAAGLAPIAGRHDLVISHGNGPQVGLLALQSAAYKEVESYPLDVLGAETEGMIGYLIEQELGNRLARDRPIVTLLTQIEVAPDDPAFTRPSKPIGPVYSQLEAEKLAAERGWTIAPDGDKFRRVVPSPKPRRILEIRAIELLLQHQVVVICAGGGGIPVMCRSDGALIGVEAVIDKDHASALLAQQLNADALLLLTDVAAVQLDWGTPQARSIRSGGYETLQRHGFAAGSMGPKVEAACAFAAATGKFAAIGTLEDAGAILAGAAGTRISGKNDRLEFYS